MTANDPDSVPPADPADGLPPQANNQTANLRRLPMVDFLAFASENAKLAKAIVSEALPEDRTRFEVYLKKRPLGLGLITGVCIA